MKKSLLLGSVLLVGVGAFAQSNMKVNGRAELFKGARPIALNDLAEPAMLPLKPKANNSVMVLSNTFSSSRNGFGILVEETVPLTYNADLNMVAFTQRLPPATGTYSWPTTGLPTTGVSGFMVTKYSTDNGATWAGTCLMNNGTAWSRYPSGVIANTPGNTDASLAKFVATGPCTASAGGWPFNFFASAPANSTGNLTTNDQRADSTELTALSGTSQGTYFSSYNTVANGTTVWTAAREIDAADAFMGVAVFKGTTSGGAYTWSRPIDAQLNNWLTNAAGNYYTSAPKFAFSPNGQIGYILINGVETDATGNASKSLQPNLWKTTDAGATWSKVNDNYDWKASHPEILCNLLTTRYDDQWNGGTNEVFPAFFDAHGGEITVDNNGKLHYVTTVVPAYSSHVDSLFYIYGEYGYSYVQNDNLDKPWVWDFTTDGNGSWDAQYVTMLYTRNIADDEVAPNFAWTTDGTASMDYTNRIKVSRSNDGTKIFTTWTDSDTTIIETLGTAPNQYQAYQPNKTPSIFYKGLDVATGMFTPTLEATYFDAVENAFYMYYTSDIVMPSANGFTIPAVYISSSDGSQNATNAVDYNYITDMEVANTDYTLAMALNTNPVDPSVCTVGLKDVSNGAISSVGQNFPNPFNGTTSFNVRLNKSEVITVNVTNAVGQVVATKVVKGTTGINEITLDAANLESGIYFYSVVAGDAKVTRKMSVVK